MQSLIRYFAISIALAVCGSTLLLIFLSIAATSVQFAQDTVGAGRPLIPVLKLFLVAFGIYMFSLLITGGFSRDRLEAGNREELPRRFAIANLTIVVVFGILFRVAMTTSTPIQEIDVYRYIWDGAVVASGHDPYRYSPGTVLDAYKDTTRIADRKVLRELCDLIEGRPGLEGVLEIIHFGRYTSPYPPTSQLFFAAAVSATDKDSTPGGYVKAIKTMLVLFDVATGILVVLLLIHVGMRPELSVSYWWCPLMIKEIANSGHLDSIATFFAVFAVYLTTRALWSKGSIELPDRKQIWFNSLTSAIALAAAVAAKVFPVVLFPIWAIALLRRKPASAVVAIGLFVMTTIVFCWPMARHMERIRILAPRLAVLPEQDETPDPSGLEAFSKYWEMNDFLFMLVVENLKPSSVKPSSELDASSGPWFRVTSDTFRTRTAFQVALSHSLVQLISNNLEAKLFNSSMLDPDENNSVAAKAPYTLQNYAFFATRGITTAVFGLIVSWFCILLIRNPDPERFLEMAFLTIAWFWLLSPTQNPWYWTWAMPLLVFARGRTWYLVSGVLFAYYLRFWFGYHYDKVDVGLALKTHNPSGIYDRVFPWSETHQYFGKTFFDFYIPIYEFGSLLLLLLIAFFGRTILSAGRFRQRDSKSS